MSCHRCLPGGENDGQDGGWSQVNDGWHGDPPPAGWADHDVNFDDSAWAPASEFGLNGVGPWGDVNREMGAADDGGLGVISADAQWIWSADPDAHNDVYCRLVVPCGEGGSTDGVDIEFYFGTGIPESAGPGAQNDDGTGYTAEKGYGWNIAGATPMSSTLAAAAAWAATTSSGGPGNATCIVEFDGLPDLRQPGIVVHFPRLKVLANDVGSHLCNTDCNPGPSLQMR